MFILSSGPGLSSSFGNVWRAIGGIESLANGSGFDQGSFSSTVYWMSTAFERSSTFTIWGRPDPESSLSEEDSGCSLYESWLLSSS